MIFNGCTTYIPCYVMNWIPLCQLLEIMISNCALSLQASPEPNGTYRCFKCLLKSHLACSVTSGSTGSGTETLRLTQMVPLTSEPTDQK